MHEVLHALRIKGRASAAEVAHAVGVAAEDVEAAFRELAADGLAVERATGRRPGWLLTTAGRDRADEQVRTAHDETIQGLLAAQYSTFLHCNDQVKQLCASWQTAADEQRRFTLLDDLHELHEQVDPALDKAGEAVDRFHRYRVRLATALERVPDDPRYLVSPIVDSFHTVWFECHEDFLLSLGKSRAQEGSW